MLYKAIEVSDQKAVIVNTSGSSVFLTVEITLESNSGFSMGNLAGMLAMCLNSGMNTIQVKEALGGE